MVAPLKKHKATKFAPPDGLRCSIMDTRGHTCERLAQYVVTRLDGTSYKACGLDAKKLREMTEDHPEHYDKLRFTAINKWDKSYD